MYSYAVHHTGRASVAMVLYFFVPAHGMQENSIYIELKRYIHSAVKSKKNNNNNNNNKKKKTYAGIYMA
jgi:hypothetical protein